MNRRLPPEAFEYYFSLGPDRSYQAVADHYGAAKVTVTRRATEEGWQSRLRKLEQEARDRSEKRIVEEMDAVRDRHVKAARILQAKALEALRNLPPEQAMKAATALAIGWKHELLVLGEPTERQATVEEVIKREYERWMVPSVEDAELDELEEEPDGEDPPSD
jgi:hypothetical protein